MVVTKFKLVHIGTSTLYAADIFTIGALANMSKEDVDTIYCIHDKGETYAISHVDQILLRIFRSFYCHWAVENGQIRSSNWLNIPMTILKTTA